MSCLSLSNLLRRFKVAVAEWQGLKWSSGVQLRPAFEDFAHFGALRIESRCGQGQAVFVRLEIENLQR
jgi:hypothetical protein